MHGHQSVSAGVTAPVRGPAETVARMAQVVGVTPKQLQAAGRADAAEELRELEVKPERAEERRPADRKVLLRRMNEDPGYAQWVADLVETVQRGQPPDPKDIRGKDTA